MIAYKYMIYYKEVFDLRPILHTQACMNIPEVEEAGNGNGVISVKGAWPQQAWCRHFLYVSESLPFGLLLFPPESQSQSSELHHHLTASNPNSNIVRGKSITRGLNSLSILGC